MVLLLMPPSLEAADVAHKVGWQQMGRLLLYRKLLPGKHKLQSELHVYLLMSQPVCEAQKEAFY